MEFLDLPPAVTVLAVFLARVVDVSMGTVRTIMVFRGYRLLAALIGFFEVLIWLGAASQVIRNLDAWYLAFAYAGGFATGNIAGIWLESKLALGTQLVRAVSPDREIRLASLLRRDGYEVVELAGFGDDQTPVEVLLMVQPRRRTQHLLRTIQGLDPTAVCTISDVKDGTGETPQRLRGSGRPGGWRGLLRK